MGDDDDYNVNFADEVENHVKYKIYAIEKEFTES